MPLGILPKNENKGDEMVDIMDHSHQYVPVLETSVDVHIPSLNETVKVKKARIHPIIISGDYFTAARGRGAKKVKVNSDSPVGRLEGLIPAAADWHAKLTVHGVSTFIGVYVGTSVINPDTLGPAVSN